MLDASHFPTGVEINADAVVVGSGAGGSVAAFNLASSGMKTVVLEAGPQVRAQDMTRDAPKFLARYYWEGGLRTIGGSAQIPSMQGRCLGGSTVMNSAIMLRLPNWVRQEWANGDGLDFLNTSSLDDAYDRVFKRTKVTPTPMAVLGRRNLVIRDALTRAGLKGSPLPRAVQDCDGCGDCITGCSSGKKQSVDRNYLPEAEKQGAEIFTSAQVDRILLENGRAAGVVGSVLDSTGRRKLGPLTVRAPRIVMAAGATHTPVILLRSGLRARGTVGGSFYAHLGTGVMAFMEERVDPWVGATQGWGAFCPQIHGMKFECLWAPPSLIFVRWGEIGESFLRALSEIKYATVVALVYRAKVQGHVRAKRNGMPSVRLNIPQSETQVVLRGTKLAADALLNVGARYVSTGIPGLKPKLRAGDTETILNSNVRIRDLPMTANHIFGSCRMSKNPARGAVDEYGRLRGVEGIYLADASIFPSPSAVNPQATVMALSDLISRRLGEQA